MSDSLRSLPKSSSRFRRRRKRLSVRIGKLFLYIVLALLLWAFWVTRDTYSMADLIPRDQAYNVYMRNVLEKRDTVLHSEVWSLFPNQQPFSAISDLDSANLGVPDWIINNLLHDVCQLSGRDLERFSDVLFVTRMTRIGALLERGFDWFSPAERDFAGGLHLRTLPGETLHYAVRGRILLVSRSRDTLIEALTLKPETAMGDEVFDKAIEEMGIEDIHAHFRFAPDTPLGTYLEGLRVALLIEANSAWVGCRVALHPDMLSRWAPVLEGVRPAQLHEPPPGAIAASLNFNRPVDALWRDFQQALGASEEPGAGPLAFLEDWQQGVEGAEELPLNHLLSLIFAQVEPEFSISLVGIDHDEMLPAPEFMLWATPASDSLQALLDAVPEEDMEANTESWTSMPRRSRSTGLVYVPMIGGPAIEPALGMLNDKLFFSTSHRLAEEVLLQRLPEVSPVSSPANIFLQIDPQILANDLYETGLLLAQIGAIRNHTESSYIEAGSYYLSQAENVEDIAALMSYLDDELHLDIKLRMVE